MNKLLRWAVIAFIIWWVIKIPTQAGHEVGNLAHLATTAASSLATALSSI